ncbi:GtrA family protein [Propioniciclava coleopterorum]|uniref:GtrA family protein n=1 Tax=Propioniciclava coleopterorum TaxID=2714937 RepID=UPI001FE81ECB|nr:GtrA family protein [Propioniciclava coleopterorum]
MTSAPDPAGSNLPEGPSAPERATPPEGRPGPDVRGASTGSAPFEAGPTDGRAGRRGPLADGPGDAASASAVQGEAAERLGLRTQLVRFVLTGGLSAIVDYGLLVAGMALGLSHAPAKAISWVFGTLTAYLINSKWTFQSDGNRRTLAAVVVLYLLTFGLQVGTFTLIYPFLESWWGVAAAQFVGFVIAQGLATTVNFIVQRAVIFK